MGRTLTASLLVGGASLAAIALVAATAAPGAPQFASHNLAHEAGAATSVLNAAASRA